MVAISEGEQPDATPIVMYGSESHLHRKDGVLSGYPPTKMPNKIGTNYKRALSERVPRDNVREPSCTPVSGEESNATRTISDASRTTASAVSENPPRLTTETRLTYLIEQRQDFRHVQLYVLEIQHCLVVFLLR